MHFQNLTICGRVVYAPELTKNLVKVRLVCDDSDNDAPLFITGCAYGSVSDALMDICAVPGDSITVYGRLRVVRRDDRTAIWMDIARFHVVKREQAASSKKKKKRAKCEPVGAADDGSNLL